MDKQGFTPGPWTVSPDIRGAVRFVGPTTGAVATVYVRDKKTSAPQSADDWNDPDPELEANARLIAAAPDLLADLQYIDSAANLTLKELGKLQEGEVIEISITAGALVDILRHIEKATA